jgi:hypothetical protein
MTLLQTHSAVQVCWFVFWVNIEGFFIILHMMKIYEKLLKEVYYELIIIIFKVDPLYYKFSAIL